MKSDIRTVNHSEDKVEKKLLKVGVLMGYSNVNLDKSQKLLQFETKKSLTSNSNGLKVQIYYSDDGESTELVINCDWLPTLGVKPLINISDKLFNKTVDDFLNNLNKLLGENSKNENTSSSNPQNLSTNTVSEEIKTTLNSTNKKNRTILWIATTIAILIVLYIAVFGFS